jgi:hypothetical protein
MIHRIPSGEIDERKLNQTLRLSRWLMVAGVLTIAVMIVFYVLPYAAGRDASALEVGRGTSVPVSVLKTGGDEHER